MNWVFNDGGRKAAGFKGRAPGDCVTRAIAIATEIPYIDVYNSINDLVKRIEKRGLRSSARTGVVWPSVRVYMNELGWIWTPTMTIGSGCRVHLRSEELPSGRLMVQVTRHAVAVIDGVIHDLNDCSRHGRRCVYGYYSKG